MQEDIFQKINKIAASTNPVDIKNDEVYMAIKILSTSPSFFVFACELNRLCGKLPTWAINYLLQYGEKKINEASFFYPKKDKIKEAKTINLLIKKIINVYHCSDKHARQIVEIFKKSYPEALNKFGIELEGKIE